MHSVRIAVPLVLAIFLLCSKMIKNKPQQVKPNQQVNLSVFPDTEVREKQHTKCSMLRERE